MKRSFIRWAAVSAALIGAGLSGLRELALERQHSETLRDVATKVVTLTTRPSAANT